MTGVILSDGYRTGQGTHGSLGRQDTFNCMIAFGPDFKAHFSDTDPCSNADIVNTLAHITGIDMKKNARGTLQGRVLTEALKTGPAVRGSKALVKASDATPDGVKTFLQYQEYNDGTGIFLYFDAGGFPGKTVGLTAK